MIGTDKDKILPVPFAEITSLKGRQVSPTSTIAPLKKNFTCRSAGTLAVTCRKIDAAATRPGHFSHQENKKRM